VPRLRTLGLPRPDHRTTGQRHELPRFRNGDANEEFLPIVKRGELAVNGLQLSAIAPPGMDDGGKGEQAAAQEQGGYQAGDDHHALLNSKPVAEATTGGFPIKVPAARMFPPPE